MVRTLYNNIQKKMLCYLIIDKKKRLPVWRDRIRRLATDPVVMRSSPDTDIIIRVVHCRLINPNKLNLYFRGC